MKTALSVLEEIYNMAINPELDYFAQLEPLASNGELANHNSSLKVLMKLCMLLDEQAKKIKSLEEKYVDNVKNAVEAQPQPQTIEPISVPVVDPTKPYNEQTTNQA